MKTSMRKKDRKTDAPYRPARRRRKTIGTGMLGYHHARSAFPLFICSQQIKEGVQCSDGHETNPEDDVLKILRPFNKLTSSPPRSGVLRPLLRPLAGTVILPIKTRKPHASTD